MKESQRFIEARLDAVRPGHAWRTGIAREPWQAELRELVRERLGLQRLKACPLDPSLELPSEERGFRRTLLTFASQPGYRSFGYLLEQLEAAEPGPAIICLPGHGVGVDAIVGLADEPYQAGFAVQCVKHGYRVLALEPMSFGRRESERIGEHGWSCDADAKAALMLGETLAGWRVWEAMRGIDLLQEVSCADPARIGIMGISGGGLTALWTAALDTRIKAAVVSGYFCTFRESILSIDHCLDNFVPGILDLIEMPDLAGLVAPRAFFAESGTNDPIFPLFGFKRAVAKAQEIYAEAGAEESFAFEIFEGGHEFKGGKAFEFLQRRL